MSKEYKEEIDYEWREYQNSGVTPSIRYNTSSIVIGDTVWLLCGAGAGVGRSNQVWKYDITSNTWQLVHCTGDIPLSRDGHSATYIGGNKIVLYGGQGPPYENDAKSEKITANFNVKTFLIRELFSDLYEFDCSTYVWSRITVDGASLPMGRRGHTAVFISPKILSHSRSNNKARIDNEPIQDSLHNSLLIFGGAGVEPSKYTEIVFNELWAFSFDTKRWTKLTSNGFEPYPIFDHTAEVVMNKFMIIAGGVHIYNGASKAAAAVEADRATYYSGVSVLNLSTLGWTNLELADSFGNKKSFITHGHSCVLDKRGSSRNFVTFYLFGGKDFLRGEPKLEDRRRSRRISSSPQHLLIEKHQHQTAWKLVVPLNFLEPASLSQFTTSPGSTTPSNRYGHAAALCLLDLPPDRPNKQSKSGYEMELEGITEPVKPLRVATSYLKPFQSFDEPLMFLYGGCDLQESGFCEPKVYILMRTHSCVEVSASNRLRSVDTANLKAGEGAFDDDTSTWKGGTVRSNMSMNSGLTYGGENLGEQMTIWDKKLNHLSLQSSPCTKPKIPESFDELRFMMSFPSSQKVKHDPLAALSLTGPSRKQMLSSPAQQTSPSSRFPSHFTKTPGLVQSSHGVASGSSNTSTTFPSLGRKTF